RRRTRLAWPRRTRSARVANNIRDRHMSSFELLTSRRSFSGIIGAVTITALLGAALWRLPLSHAAEQAVKLPEPAVDVAPSHDGLQTVVLAGGCFWGVQAVFQHTDGVVRAMSGYSGDSRQTATYDIVSSGRTKHAEAVEVRFDPKKISYGKILQ